MLRWYYYSKVYSFITTKKKKKKKKNAHDAHAIYIFFYGWNKLKISFEKKKKLSIPASSILSSNRKSTVVITNNGSIEHWKIGNN